VAPKATAELVKKRMATPIQTWQHIVIRLGFDLGFFQSLFGLSSSGAKFLSSSGDVALPSWPDANSQK